MAEQWWTFTFGQGHKHPYTGEPLCNRYVKLRGSFEEAREKMIQSFGRTWAFQYASDDEAGVERFALRQIALP